MMVFEEGADIYSSLRGTSGPGLYIVQSTRDPSCFRIGAAGVQTGRSGSLFKRLTQHHRHKTPKRHDVNWTEYYRKWDIIWATLLDDASQLSIRLAEGLVFGHFAARFHFLPESEGSGFYALPSTVDEIYQEAKSLEPLIAAIVRRQADVPDRPVWKKGDKLTPPSFVHEGISIPTC